MAAMDDGTAATHIPDFDLPASTGRNLSLSSFQDRVPMAIVFLTGLEEDRDLLDVLNESLPRFGDLRSQLLAVVPEMAEDVERFSEDNGIVVPVLADSTGQMRRDFEAHDDSGQPRRMAFVATAEGRLVTRLDELSVDDGVEQLLGELDDLHLGADVEPADR